MAGVRSILSVVGTVLVPVYSILANVFITLAEACTVPVAVCTVLTGVCRILAEVCMRILAGDVGRVHKECEGGAWQLVRYWPCVLTTKHSATGKVEHLI
jgi:hypothetical protein